MQGKNILVIGASSGIGYALAEKLIANGANVYAVSRRGESPDGCKNIQADVTAEINFGSEISEVLHGIAYCPGTITLKPLQSLNVKDFLADFEVNLIGAFNTIKASLKALRASGDASIVLFSTVAVGTGMSFHASVAAAKGAVEGFARSIAAELAPKNIRVNVIAPSLTDTPLAANLLSSDEKREASAKRHPLNRIGQADEIAEMAAYLLGNNSSFITGQVFHLDGGMSRLK